MDLLISSKVPYSIGYIKTYLNHFSFQLFYLMNGFSHQDFPNIMKKVKGLQTFLRGFFLLQWGGWMRRNNSYHSTLLQC